MSTQHTVPSGSCMVTLQNYYSVTVCVTADSFSDEGNEEGQAW